MVTRLWRAVHHALFGMGCVFLAPPATYDLGAVVLRFREHRANVADNQAVSIGDMSNKKRFGYISRKRVYILAFYRHELELSTIVPKWGTNIPNGVFRR